MNSLLPIVTQYTGYSVQHDVPINEDSSDWIAKHLEKMVESNPCLASFIANFAKECPEDWQEAVLMSNIVVYRLLESQAEADRMMEELKPV